MFLCVCFLKKSLSLLLKLLQQQTYSVTVLSHRHFVHLTDRYNLIKLFLLMLPINSHFSFSFESPSATKHLNDNSIIVTASQ